MFYISPPFSHFEVPKAISNYVNLFKASQAQLNTLLIAEHPRTCTALSGKYFH